MKVSVIVPVYNVEKYLEKSLTSLANQTLKDIEIIIVNDGSPDNSQKIIDKYVEKYPNMKSYIKENGGLSDARNYGIKKATGDYIAFLDSDDYISEDAYELMYKKAIDGNFDMVVCDLNFVYPDKVFPVTSGIIDDTCDIKKTYISIYPAAWNKLYKKELLKDIGFKKGVWFEDVEFIYRLLPRIKNIGVVHKPFIQYVQREGSIINTVNPKIYDYISNMNGVVEYYQKNNLYDEYKKELEYVYVRYIYATFIKSVKRYEYKEYLKAVDEAIKNVHEYFPGYRKNKYFYKSPKGIYLVLFNKLVAKIFYKIKKD